MLEIILSVKEKVTKPATSNFRIIPQIRKSTQYEPDKNGYFVCKDNLLITNINLCKQYQQKNFNRTDSSQPYNLNCAICTLKLEAVNGKSLNDFNQLSQDLQTIIETYHKPSSLEYHYLDDEFVPTSSVERRMEKINNSINYGEDLSLID